MVKGPGDHLDETAEISLELIKSRAVKGVLTLTGRTFFLQATTLVATFFLTVFLEPAQWGVFFLVSAVVNFFAYFSDIGLAAALIQRKEKLTANDLRTTFTVQQVLVFGLLAIIFLVTPLLRKWYGFPQESVYLLWALGFSLLLSSLKTIPSVLLERRLEFGKLIIPQIVETILFYMVAVSLAWQEWGVASFTVAVLVRGVSGLIVIYLLQPWTPGIAFAKDSLKGLLRFGIPYQANTFLAVAKDDGLIMVLGGILGAGGIGLLGWAQKWAYAPLRFFMDQVIKVTFPAYARMQDNKEELSNAVSRSLFFICLLVFPSLLGLVLLAPLLTEIIPKYEKWQPALLALGLYGVGSAWAAVTTPLTNLLNSIGRISTTFRLMIMWTILTWVFIPVLAMLYGVNGAAAGAAIVGLSSIIAIFVVRRHIGFSLLASVGKPALAAAVMGIFIYVFQGVLPVSFLGVAAVIVLGIVVYWAAIFLLVGPSIISDVREIRHALVKN